MEAKEKKKGFSIWRFFVWLGSKIGVYPAFVCLIAILLAGAFIVRDLADRFGKPIVYGTLILIVALKVINILYKFISWIKRCIDENREYKRKRKELFNKNKVQKHDVEMEEIDEIVPDPNFNYDEFLRFSQYVLKAYWKALYDLDEKKMLFYCSDLMIEQLKLEIEDLTIQGIKDYTRLEELESIRLSNFRQDLTDEYLDVVFTCYVKNNPRIGKRTSYKYSKLLDIKNIYTLTFIRKKGSQTVNEISRKANCINCGADIDLSESNCCPYCNSYYTMGSNSWLLDKYEYNTSDRVRGYIGY